MENNLALQERMGHLLKEKFQGMDIARPLEFYSSVVEALDASSNEEYIAILQNGRPFFYLKNGSSSTVEFKNSICLEESVSLRETISRLAENDVVFIKSLDQVIAYVTVSDIQKAPVRMWLFGMITVIEMFLVRILSDYYSEAEWQALISPGRVEKAVQLLEERRRRGQDPLLIDCLQLTDKFEILAKSASLLEEYGFGSKTFIRKGSKAVEALRNSLAHSQHIDNWSIVVGLSNRLDKIITRI